MTSWLDAYVLDDATAEDGGSRAGGAFADFLVGSHAFAFAFGFAADLTGSTGSFGCLNGFALQLLQMWPSGASPFTHVLSHDDAQSPQYQSFELAWYQFLCFKFCVSELQSSQ